MTADLVVLLIDGELVELLVATPAGGVKDGGRRGSGILGTESLPTGAPPHTDGRGGVSPSGCMSLAVGPD